MNDQQPRIEIDSEQCKGCQLCVLECPKNCIEMTHKFNQMGYCYAVYKQEGCIGCGTCYYACPEVGTIKVFKKVRSPK